MSGINAGKSNMAVAIHSVVAPPSEADEQYKRILLATVQNAECHLFQFRMYPSCFRLGLLKSHFNLKTDQLNVNKR